MEAGKIAEVIPQAGYCEKASNTIMVQITVYAISIMANCVLVLILSALFISLEIRALSHIYNGSTSTKVYLLKHQQTATAKRFLVIKVDL
jgi:hypothetical protein